MIYEALTESARRLQTVEVVGRVEEVRGLLLSVMGLHAPVGSMVDVHATGGPVPGEVVGFDEDRAMVMLLGAASGIRRADRVVAGHGGATAVVSSDMLGRVVDALGRPIDGKGPIRETSMRPLRPGPIDPMRRVPIDQPLGTGVGAIDAMLTAGRGQRLGIFSGPGVGKSTLLGMIARQTEADVSVLALVGERGREVIDFIERTLGPEGMARSVVVVATGDEPAPMRIRAALMATAIAEHFRDTGSDVMLLMDSVTRFCQAQRQVGLAAGEPPTTKGYTPSVFAELPALLERSGRTDAGSITGFYTVLVEGDDLTDPVSDAARAILDGHVVLDRSLASRGHWPAIDVLSSISRVAVDVIDSDHDAARASVARLMSLWSDVEDLVNIGAYAKGSNPEYDLAIEIRPEIENLLAQKPEDRVVFREARGRVIALAGRIAKLASAMQRQGAGV